jgi:hypothetical protein
VTTQYIKGFNLIRQPIPLYLKFFCKTIRLWIGIFASDEPFGDIKLVPLGRKMACFADCQNDWPLCAKRLAAVIKWRQSSLLAAPPDFASGRGYGEC